MENTKNMDITQNKSAEIYKIINIDQQEDDVTQYIEVNFRSREKKPLNSKEFNNPIYANTLNKDIGWTEVNRSKKSYQSQKYDMSKEKNINNKEISFDSYPYTKVSYAPALAGRNSTGILSKGCVDCCKPYAVTDNFSVTNYKKQQLYQKNKNNYNLYNNKNQNIPISKSFNNNSICMENKYINANTSPRSDNETNSYLYEKESKLYAVTDSKDEVNIKNNNIQNNFYNMKGENNSNKNYEYQKKYHNIKNNNIKSENFFELKKPRNNNFQKIIRNEWNGFDENGNRKWFIEFENGNIVSYKDKNYISLSKIFNARESYPSSKTGINSTGIPPKGDNDTMLQK